MIHTINKLSIYKEGTLDTERYYSTTGTLTVENLNQDNEGLVKISFGDQSVVVDIIDLQKALITVEYSYKKYIERKEK